MGAMASRAMITHSGILAKLGYQLDWYQPDQGDVLPKIDESVAITLIYGGGKPEDEKDWYTKRYPWLNDPPPLKGRSDDAFGPML